MSGSCGRICEGRRRRSVLRLVVMVVAWPLSGSSAATAQRPPIVSTIDANVPAAPFTIAVSGRQHLVYELHLTNVATSDVSVRRIQVVDAARDAVIGDLSDLALSSRIGSVGASASDRDSHLIAPGTRAVVYLWLPLENGTPHPSRLRHRITLDARRAGERIPVVVTGADAEVRREQPLVLAPPVSAGPWVALYDPAMLGGHRTAMYAIDGRARIPARFAVDFVRLQNDGTHARGERSLIANWHGYGAEVLAVADATVVEARDDIPEAPSIAPQPVPLENVSGNFVSLDLGGGRYAFYEHLKHGSIRVKAGDRVAPGDVLASLGNSGSSSAGPHLHFHVADARAELAGEGLPFVFAAFEVLGRFDDVSGFVSGVRWKPARSGEGGVREHEMPAPNSVVVFPRGTPVAGRRQ